MVSEGAAQEMDVPRGRNEKEKVENNSCYLLSMLYVPDTAPCDLHVSTSLNLYKPTFYI